MLSAMRRRRAALVLAVVLAALVTLAWATDAVRPQGVRTIYTVKCKPGTWEGSRCYGRLVAGPTYRFEIMETSGDVRFSSSDAPAAKGAFSGCRVADRGNWSCEPTAETVTTIAHEMNRGHPVADPNIPTLPFHEIEKWRWLLLSIGIPVGHDSL